MIDLRAPPQVKWLDAAIKSSVPTKSICLITYLLYLNVSLREIKEFEPREMFLLCNRNNLELPCKKFSPWYIRSFIKKNPHDCEDTVLEEALPRSPYWQRLCRCCKSIPQLLQISGWFQYLVVASSFVMATDILDVLLICSQVLHRLQSQCFRREPQSHHRVNLESLSSWNHFPQLDINSSTTFR